jgi:exodeoxyribonuclease V alpha subunit
LDELHRLKALSHLDYYLCQFLLAEAKQPSQSLALAIALTSQATREGHLCLNLRELAATELFPGLELSVTAPELVEWRSALLNSCVVAKPGEWQPLVLDDQDRLYLHRYWDYEQRLARALLSRAHATPTSVDEQRLSDGLKKLFQTPKGETTDWQKCAAATAVIANLSVISGGPGTGKTSTVVRILALLRQQPGGRELRIGLAAPTGMAAARLQQAIRNAKSQLSLSRTLLDEIPDETSTLHRLLGMTRQGTGFRHHREHPLLLDVLILDEASMVDVALMAKLMDALPSRARLILLGDREQLASVEAGAVLGDICSGCEGPSPPFAETLARVTQQPVEPISLPRNALSDSVVLLRHSYRFDAESPIGRLAGAINQGDGQGAVKWLSGNTADAQVQWLADEQLTISLGADHFANLFTQIKAGASVESLFEILQSFRILCALRGGPAGVTQINLAITNRLRAQGFIKENQEWYAGRPVMLTRNDYQLNLYNGEIGIVLPHPDHADELSVAFTGSDGSLRWIAPSRLPFCETVYALTVHKSQGSEFQQVLLHLPERDSPILCRELIYTAVTRAKSQFRLVGSKAIFSGAVSRRMGRHSGLADLLQEGEEG